MLKAKVFISCGQRTSEEKSIGTQLVSYFTKRGFEPYFAEEIHSFKGLTQSIYDNLRTSEYFVGINFKRDKGWSLFRSKDDYGSLFVQQELAIASYREVELVAFHQPGIKLSGVAKYLHVNSIEFNSFKDIILNLDRLTKKWDAQSKNQFRLLFGNDHLNVKLEQQSGNMVHIVQSNWYHVIVENLSSVFTAKNCYSFVESIYDVTNKKDIFGKNEYKNELIWSGTGRIIANIPYKTKKDIDAIYTIHGSKQWLFQEINTSTLYRYPQVPDGHYKIIYTIHSDNIPEAKIEVEISLSNDKLKLLKTEQIA